MPLSILMLPVYLSVHCENTPKQYTKKNLVVKMKNFTGIFFYILKNLCFGAKIRKIGIPPHIKLGFKGGIHFTDMFSWCVIAICVDG